jgi:hypothetical protein
MDWHLLYLDPGSGSYLAQILAAAALGIVFFFRNIKMYILSFFSLFRKSANKKEKVNSNSAE